MSRRASGRPSGRAAFRSLLKDLEEESPDEAPVAAPVNRIEQAAWARKSRAGSTESLDSVLSQAGSQTSDIAGASYYQRFFAMGTEFQQRLSQAAWKFRGKSKNIQEAKKSEYHRVFSQHRHAASLSSESGGMQTDRFSLTKALQQGACFLVLFTGYLIGVLLAALTKLVTGGQHRAVLLCVKRSYDETPSKLTVSWMTVAENAKIRAKEEGATAKVLQSNCRVLMLMEHVPSKRYYTLQMAMPCWLQAMDRTTAENTAQSQRAILGLIPGLQDFGDIAKLNIQLVSTDKYSANDIANAGQPHISTHRGRIDLCGGRKH